MVLSIRTLALEIDVEDEGATLLSRAGIARLSSSPPGHVERRHYKCASLGTTMERVEVGIRELRLNLSRYVARVRDGAEVIVTDRGQPVARLGPIEDGESKRARLIREGRLTPARRPKSTTLPPPIPLSGDGPLVSEMVLEDRR